MLTGSVFADKTVINNDPNSTAVAGAIAGAKAKATGGKAYAKGGNAQSSSYAKGGRGGKAVSESGSDVTVKNKSLGLGSVGWAQGQTGFNLGGVVGYSTVSKKTVEGQNLYAIEDQTKKEEYICIVRTDYEKAKHLKMCKNLPYFVNRAAAEKNRGRYIWVKEATYGDDH